jgi:hypothetical protein
MTIMRKLSEILNDIKLLEEEWIEVNETHEDDEEKDIILTDLDLAIDCLAMSLICGDFINDLGRPYNYFEE